MSRSLSALALSFLLSFPATAQTLTPEMLQGDLGQMLLNVQPQVDQPTAAPSPALETTVESDSTASQVELLDGASSNSLRPPQFSASQLYFRTLLGEVLQPFGLSEFKNPGPNELLLFNALSGDYKLSAGDQLQIVIRGLSPTNFTVVLDRSGAVTLPQFLPISLAGLTVDEAAAHLADLIKVEDASARVSVVVTAARLVPVQVGGMVKDPQVIAIPAYTPLGLAIARSGGLRPDASLRSVRLISQEGGTRVIDLYGLLLGEAEFREPLLTEGERIFVPTSGGSVAITGIVPRHGIFELLPGQESITISEALTLSGLSLAPKGLPIERVFFDADGLPVSVAVSDPENTRLASGEALRVGQVKTVEMGNVMVLGSVIEAFSQPFVKDLKLSAVLKGGAVLAPQADADLILVVSLRGGDLEDAQLIAVKDLQSGKNDPVLAPGKLVFIPSRNEVNQILRSISGEAVAGIDATVRSVADYIVLAKPVKVYVDGKIVAILPGEVPAGLIDRFTISLARTDLYRDYAIIEAPDGSLSALGLGSIEGDGVLALKLGFGTKLHLFSRGFITSTLKDKVTEDVIDLNSESMSAVPQLPEKIYRRMVADSRQVLGEVSEPGAYPVAGRLNLADIIAASGGILPSGDKSAVVLRQYRVDEGVLSLDQERVIDTTKLDPSSVVLSGIFNIRVQPLINDAIVGVVTISGEVRRPGRLSIMRGDTIADVLARAGGLTNTAYPLGAVLSRASLIEVERRSNGELAKQLRESVMLQPKQDGAETDQIRAVLDFAGQLEAAPAIGRQVVNILDAAEASSVLMQDGDRLVVPNRPSHVQIAGAVYSEVAAQYREGASPADYVADAGGLTRFADPRRGFIIFPNGKSLPINLRKKGGNAEVPPGSIIVVPPKVDRVSALQLTDTITRALGSIASSVLALDVITGP